MFNKFLSSSGNLFKVFEKSFEKSTSLATTAPLGYLFLVTFLKAFSTFGEIELVSISKFLRDVTKSPLFQILSASKTPVPFLRESLPSILTKESLSILFFNRFSTSANPSNSEEGNSLMAVGKSLTKVPPLNFLRTLAKKGIIVDNLFILN